MILVEQVYNIALLKMKMTPSPEIASVLWVSAKKQHRFRNHIRSPFQIDVHFFKWVMLRKGHAGLYKAPTKEERTQWKTKSWERSDQVYWYEIWKYIFYIKYITYYNAYVGFCSRYLERAKLTQNLAIDSEVWFAAALDIKSV